MAKPPPVILTWRNLHLADGAVASRLDRRLLAEAGCSLLEHDLLAWLAAAPDRRLQMLDLADRLAVTRGGLTRIVDRLADRGHVERDRPAANRREVYAVLTSSGHDAFTDARTIYRKVLQETLGRHLDGAELAELARISAKLLKVLAIVDSGNGQ